MGLLRGKRVCAKTNSEKKQADFCYQAECILFGLASWLLIFFFEFWRVEKEKSRVKKGGGGRLTFENFYQALWILFGLGWLFVIAENFTRGEKERGGWQKRKKRLTFEIFLPSAVDIVAAGAAVGWKGDIMGTGERNAGRRVFTEGTQKTDIGKTKVSATRNRHWQWRFFFSRMNTCVYVCVCMYRGIMIVMCDDVRFVTYMHT